VVSVVQTESEVTVTYALSDSVMNDEQATELPNLWPLLIQLLVRALPERLRQ